MTSSFFHSDSTILAMCAAGALCMPLGVVANWRDVATARGLEKIVALRSVCVAVALAIFGALHLFGIRFVLSLVPTYLPLRTFWAYLVGAGLIAAALSIATKKGVRWSGLLFGAMMYAFVAMIHFPGALRTPGDSNIWTIVFREMSFGGAGWILAGLAMHTERQLWWNRAINTGGVWITLAMFVFGVRHFMHPTALPGVPLRMDMPSWVPLQLSIGYVTGAVLLLGALSVVFRKQPRRVVSLVGVWLLLLVAVIYVPFLIVSLADAATGVQLVGINYFADTLLFAGAVLSLAAASPRDVDAMHAATT